MFEANKTLKGLFALVKLFCLSLTVIKLSPYQWMSLDSLLRAFPSAALKQTKKIGKVSYKVVFVKRREREIRINLQKLWTAARPEVYLWCFEKSFWRRQSLIKITTTETFLSSRKSQKYITLRHKPNFITLMKKPHHQSKYKIINLNCDTEFEWTNEWFIRVYNFGN